MSRSVWKGYFISLKNTKRNKKNIWSRSNSIPSCLVGQKISVYNGKIFRKVKITRKKVGYKFGDFCFTRALFRFKKKKKK